MNDQSQFIKHAMPDDEVCADKSWFFRQNEFERDELKSLVKYKRETLGIIQDGCYSKLPNHTYPHILPEGELRKVFYEPMFEEILSYLKEAKIQQHTELLNLKSSQAACLNFLFPLRMNKDLATRVLNRFLPGLSSVMSIDFEYTGQDEIKGESGCTNWLGEPPGGKRGQNRTSIDAAILWKNIHGKRCVTLVEWKYSERSFGSCSAYDKAKGEDKQGCLEESFAKHCLLTSGGPHRSRHYWERLIASGINMDLLKAVAGCPFRGPFYQLMRQFLVARYMLESKQVDYADVVAVHFHKNDAVKIIPKELTALSGSDVVGAWNAVLSGVPRMRVIEVEQLMAEYDAATGVDTEWRAYIRQRYRI
jgi:hypothetical protein